MVAVPTAAILVPLGHSTVRAARVRAGWVFRSRSWFGLYGMVRRENRSAFNAHWLIICVPFSSRRRPTEPLLSSLPYSRESTVDTYRVYFRDASGIVGRHDFAADDDREATIIADSLCDACSDRCNSFEVWQRDHRVVVPRAPRSPRSDEEITAKTQAAIVECEEAIQRSQWAIASSERLLARLAAPSVRSRSLKDAASRPA